MSVSNPYSQYVDNQVLTASPGRILIMTYDAAIRFGKLAIQKMKEGNLYEQNRYIDKTQNIILELISTLNPEVNPQLAADLESLYIYMYDHLTQANINDDVKMLEDIVMMLSDLRTSWAEAELAVRRDGENCRLLGVPSL